MYTMKRQLLFMLMFLFAGWGAMAQETEKPAEIILNEASHDFGTINQGTPVYTVFEVESGNADSLNLEMVRAACGCTTPEFKAGTYAPGVKVPIRVGYNAAAIGAFNKPVTIIYNGGQQKVIFIKGKVEQTPATPAPASQAGKIKQ